MSEREFNNHHQIYDASLKVDSLAMLGKLIYYMEA